MARPAKLLNVTEVVSRHLAGEPVSRIAHSLKVHNDRIEQLLVGAGIPVRKGAWGAQHPRWTGGRYVNVHGYVNIVLERDDPFRAFSRNGLISEHRLVMMRSLNRALYPNETVHHLDGDRQNNALENLQLRQGPHGEGHVLVCRSCGSHDIETQEL